MRGNSLSRLMAAALLLTCALTGCGPSEDLDPSPDGSRPLYFKETHRLDPNVDAAPIQELMDSVGVTETAFPLDRELPEGGQYFKDGDLAEDVYEAMREYAQKHG